MKATDLFDLTGKTAIITGGGRGLGEQIATGFAEAGAREELGEDELTDLVQNGDISTPGEAASPGSQIGRAHV